MGIQVVRSLACRSKLNCLLFDRINLCNGDGYCSISLKRHILSLKFQQSPMIFALTFNSIKK